MELVHTVCCGLDVHRDTVVACLRRAVAKGEVRKEFRTFATTKQGLVELLTWLSDVNCDVAAMESTGVYWKPVHNILSAGVRIVVGNARDIKPRRGHKTDKTDADWIAELLAHDLIRPSFVPTPQIQALRDLTRLRVQLVQNRAQSKNRVHKLLQQANIKLSSVATDIFGKSGRAMMDALISGERDPKRLSALALGLLRRKVPQLELALAGTFTDHHAGMLRLSLEQIDLLSRQIGEVEAHMAHLAEPLSAELEQLTSIPGVDRTAALAIIGEIGVDMSGFGSAKRLASWTGICPGNNESAGKRKSGRARKGNRYLKRILVQCAWAARKTQSYLGQTFRTLEARIGGKKAAVAVGHKILVIAYHLLTEGTYYEEERYNRPNPRLERRRAMRALATLRHLGYTVDLSDPDVSV